METLGPVDSLLSMGAHVYNSITQSWSRNIVSLVLSWTTIVRSIVRGWREGEEGEKASLPVFLSSLLGLGVGQQTPWLLLRTSLSFSFTGKYSSKFLAHQVLSWHWFLEGLKIHIFNIIIKFTLFSPFSGCQIVCCLDLSFNPLKLQEILAEFCKQCP